MTSRGVRPIDSDSATIEVFIPSSQAPHIKQHIEYASFGRNKLLELHASETADGDLPVSFGCETNRTNQPISSEN